MLHFKMVHKVEFDCKVLSVHSCTFCVMSSILTFGSGCTHRVKLFIVIKCAALYTVNLSVSLKMSALSFFYSLLQTEEVEYLVLEAVVTLALTLNMEEFIYMV